MGGRAKAVSGIFKFDCFPNSLWLRCCKGEPTAAAVEQWREGEAQGPKVQGRKCEGGNMESCHIYDDFYGV